MRELFIGACDEFSIDVKGLRSDGNTLDIKMELSSVTFDDEQCWQFVIRDRSEALEVRAQLDYLKTHDPMTGLRNRHHLFEALADVMSSEGETSITLIYLELDHFHALRETIGVEAGDEVMVRVARTLGDVTRSEDLVARFGDGVFGILSTTLIDSEAEAFCRQLCATVESRALETKGRSISATCSIGVACAQPGTRSPQSMLRKTQQACREDEATRFTRCCCAPSTARAETSPRQRSSPLTAMSCWQQDSTDG